MSDIVLTLGPIAFQNFEIPERVNFGGAQRLAIHHLPGGARVIDAMGRDDAEITFNGIFSGENSTLRARALDELRALGTVLPLTWDVFFYSVVIKNFSADYQTGNWIPFRLACTVLRDEASAVIDVASSLATSLLSDISVVSTAALSLGIGLASAQQALAQPDAATRGTASYAVASASLASVREDIGTGIGVVESTLDPDTLFAPGDPHTGAAALDTNEATMAQLAALSVARAYAGRAAANLANAST